MSKENIEKERIFKTIKAEKFRDKNGYYLFPFEVIDKTPGGSNLGRIEWHIELIPGRKIRGRYYFEKMHIWASQTRDEKYRGRVFEIPCYAECITGDSINRESYINYVWRIMPCELHKRSVVFSAYPANHHKVLKIDCGSSISIEAEFIP